MENKNKSTRYSKIAFRVRDIHGKIVDGPQCEKETISEFVHRMGVRKEHIEGGTPLETNSHIRLTTTHLMQEIIAKNDIHTICDIGFNAGTGTFILLEALEKKWGNTKDWQSVSFDLGLHPYVIYAKLYIDARFPGRHTLLLGDSKQSVPKFTNYSSQIFDFLFIDGDHTYKGAMDDIVNCKLLANKNTIVLFDNVAPHRGVGTGPYHAIKDMVLKNKFLIDQWIELPNFFDAHIIGRYFLKGSKSAIIQKPDWNHYERFVAVRDVTEEFSKKKQSFPLLQKYQMKLKEIENKELGKINQYAKNQYEIEYQTLISIYDKLFIELYKKIMTMKIDKTRLSDENSIILDKIIQKQFPAELDFWQQPTLMILDTDNEFGFRYYMNCKTKYDRICPERNQTSEKYKFGKDCHQIYKPNSKQENIGCPYWIRVMKLLQELLPINEVNIQKLLVTPYLINNYLGSGKDVIMPVESKIIRIQMKDGKHVFVTLAYK